MEKKDALRVPVPGEIVKQMEAGAKALEVRENDVANWIEAQGAYYIDRLSETRNAYILIRRERKA